jgi:hypothetical protein
MRRSLEAEHALIPRLAGQPIGSIRTEVPKMTPRDLVPCERGCPGRGGLAKPTD